jgi:hypothetical protein
MASTAHGTLTGNEVTTVTIRPGDEGIVVVNRDLEGEMWVRVDGENPGIGAPDSYVVIGARQFPLPRRIIAKQAITVKLIADAGRAFSVEAVQ